jgi:transposase-like protein
MGRFQEGWQSVTEFCRSEGVSAPSFYQWRKRLAQRPRVTEEASGFRAVRLVGNNAALVAAGVVVQLPGGTRLEVPTSDSQALRLVIDALARADAERGGGGPC